MNRPGFLGLGSNIGDRRAHLKAAVAALPRHGVEVLASSSVYETVPVGLFLDQREFYNACLRVMTELDPEPLLDVDLLLLDDLEFESQRLRLPHPEVSSRRFVLVPLLELEPELTLPDGVRLADAMRRLGDGQAVRRVGRALV